MLLPNLIILVLHVVIDKEWRTTNNVTLVGTMGDKIGIVARFSKSEGRLLGVECSGLYNGQQVTVLTVDQIDFDVPPTE